MPIPIPMDRQLDAIRETAEFSVVHIDTCLACYLQDHHNRDGELLLGVTVTGETTIGEVFNELEDEFRSIAWDIAADRKGFDYDKAFAAIKAERSKHHPMDLDRKLFDPSLDIPTEEDYEDMAEFPKAWFLIVWSVPEEETG